MLAAPVKETEENKPADDDFPYIGYMEGSSGIGMKLYVEKKPKQAHANPDNRRVVYCFNKTKAWPDTFDNTKELAYKKTTGSVDAFENKVNKNSQYKGQNLIDKLKIVLANGYPNNDAIQKSLGLSDDEMRTVTQMAVWHFTDNEYNNLTQIQSISDQQVLALAILIDKAGSSTVRSTDLASLLEKYKKDNPSYEVPKGYIPPEQSTLDLYISNGTLSADHNKEYQNLLSGHLVKPDGSVIEIPRDNTKKEEKEIMIQKLGNNVQIAGAVFEIAKENDPDNVLKTITSEASGPSTVKLEVGTYILNETTAPKGFQKLSGVKFRIKDDGDIEVIETGKYEDGTDAGGFEVSVGVKNLYITDKEKPEGQEEPETGNKTKLIIRKYAKGDYKKLLEGAELELYKISDDEKEGTLLEGGNFKSGSKGKEFELEDGFYILKEKKAPNGYKVADDINIEVKNEKVLIDGEEASKYEESYIISMEDEAIGQTYIFFSKQDILGKELAGAKLEIIDKSTNDVIKEWVSGGSTTTFKLSEGSYKLVETAAPKSYKIATEINFAVDKDGKVSADEGSLKTIAGNNVIVMVDDYKESKIFFSKQDILGKELAGAKLQIKEKETDKVVREWTSGETSDTFALKPGKYEFVETAAPKGYKIATAIDFEITLEGEIKADTKSIKTIGDNKILVMVDDYEDKKEDAPKKPDDKTKPNDGGSDDKDSGKKKTDLKTSDEKDEDRGKEKEDEPSERKTNDSKIKTEISKENKDKTDKSLIKDKDVSKETLTRNDDYRKSKDTSRRGYNYSPKTGVSTNIGFYLATIALSGGALAFISKKNKKN